MTWEQATQILAILWLWRLIWEWCIDHKIWLSAAHIPVKQNRIADFESPRNQRTSEWRHDKASLICALERLDFKPDVDFFPLVWTTSSHIVSYTPDPEAVAIDAFSLSWSNLDFYLAWVGPTSIFILFLHLVFFHWTVLNKLTTGGAQGIYVLPDWRPTQPWYPRALQLLKQNPVYLKARKDLLKLPSHPKENHPIWHRLNLLVHVSYQGGTKQVCFITCSKRCANGFMESRYLQVIPRVP